MLVVSYGMGPPPPPPPRDHLLLNTDIIDPSEFQPHVKETFLYRFDYFSLKESSVLFYLALKQCRVFFSGR